MTDPHLLKAAAQFGKGTPVAEQLGEGLIHRTYKVNYSNEAEAIVLQRLNQRAFSQPENIIRNYQMLYDHLEKQRGGIQIPMLIPTHQNKFFWVDESDNFWRATRFISGSYSLSFIETETDAYVAAKTFANFTRSLNGINTEQLNIVLPNFHNLEFRYRQFEDAISKAAIQRLLRSTHLISELRQRKALVKYYQQLSVDEEMYPTRLMHNDCKVSNILFDRNTKAALSPVDLDTVMPGKFFSDIGDMFRTMACSVDENSTAWEEIAIRGDYYRAVVSGYLEGMAEVLTSGEKDEIHHSGLIMIYMQSLRFVTDFLNNDIYYKTLYPEQNLNRALNQFILLEKLEDFLAETYHHTLYDID